MERVVDRSELLSDRSTPPSSPELQDIPGLGDFDFIKQDEVTRDQDHDNDDDELDFMLFAPAAKTSDATQPVAKIRVQTPPPEDLEPGILQPRPEAYYFRGNLSAQEQQNFEAVALSGQDVQSQSHSIRPGSAYAWKLLHVPTTRRQWLALSNHEMHKKLLGDSVPSQRKRPGKKARIKARIKLEAAKVKKDEQQKAAEVKEAAEREKRTRKNREKKVKKRQKEKAKKLEAQSGQADDGTGDAEQDSGSAG